jgi:protein-S-isoprenylcysteine O-methyltransferase Ste14
MNLTRWSLALKNFIFIVLQPGIVAGLLPFLIAKNNFKSVFTNFLSLHHYVGLLTSLAGLFIMLHCVVSFVIDGLGTLSPAVPTKRLVISGLYKFSRNPMYVGVMLILFGEVAFTVSVYLLFYSIGIFVLFNLFIVYREEPRLKKDFEQDYETYCKTVRRWI